MTHIEVCEICDIAGCRHIRERQAHQSAPQEVWIGIRGVNTRRADQGDVRYISHDASPEVVATMPGAQAMVAAAVEAAETVARPVAVEHHCSRIPAFHATGNADDESALVRCASAIADNIRALTPADAQAALDRMIAEAVAKAEAERDAARVGWVKLPEVPDPKWVSADDTRRFVVSFHDLQRAHLIAGLADIDHVDDMWMTICTDCERALATEAST